MPLSGIRRTIWDGMWGQPVATLWNLVDVAPLTRLVILQTTLEALGDKDLLAEMRHLEDRFLLNPYSRAQQRVVLAGEDIDVEVDDIADARRRRFIGLSGEGFTTPAEALVALTEGLAAAIESDPDNAALWREYRAALATLMAFEGDGDDETKRFLLEVRAAVGNTAGPEQGVARPRGGSRSKAARAPTDAVAAGGRGRSPRAAP